MPGLDSFWSLLIATIVELFAGQLLQVITGWFGGNFG